uniref:Uncharacterized protein n=1 Tax=Globisporangium ultimum (strain ATCC 200006 / CBS 805.95 / DAOM BR144) TaxID=431595 RepID=K3WDC0_GLOUD
MNIFAFLDANSVFAVSLMNHSLLARVHVMFGMETTVGNNEGGKQRKPSPVKQSQPSPKPRIQQIKGRSQSFMNPSEKEKAQLSKVEMIVKSLKKDEIKLFHEMSTRVKTLETHLGQVQAEKEDIAARLHGAENVRDFLMDKLKDLEDRLSSIMETSSKKDEQAVLDREIIGFLDAKTQEYETTLKKCAKQNEEYRTELTRLHEEHSAKMTIIQDMVELLTHEKQDLELQLRSQRKVLVREVKVLRAHNQQLVTEKEQYFTQLKQLKHALHHLDELT